jgi:hypothetical protein
MIMEKQQQAIERLYEEGEARGLGKSTILPGGKLDI